MSFSAYMVASLKHNKRTRISAFKKMEDFKEGKNIQVHFDKTATPHQLKTIREKLQTENRKSLKKKIIIFTIAMFVIIYAIGFVKF
jgi:hypothetical protein